MNDWLCRIWQGTMERVCRNEKEREMSICNSYWKVQWKARRAATFLTNVEGTLDGFRHVTSSQPSYLNFGSAPSHSGESRSVWSYKLNAKIFDKKQESNSQLEKLASSKLS